MNACGVIIDGLSVQKFGAVYLTPLKPGTWRLTFLPTAAGGMYSYDRAGRFRWESCVEVDVEEHELCRVAGWVQGYDLQPDIVAWPCALLPTWTQRRFSAVAR